MEQDTIVIVGSMIGLVVVAVAAILSFGHILTGLVEFVKIMIGNPALEAGLAERASELKPGTRRGLLTLIAIADPLAKATPTDLDDETIAWLRRILVQAGSDDLVAGGVLVAAGGAGEK